MGREDRDTATRPERFSRRARVLAAVGLVVVLVALLFGLAVFAMDTLRGVRGFVGAEGLWSKNQKDAVQDLDQYRRSGDAAELESFRRHLALIDGLRQSRLQLDSGKPDMRVVRRGFSELGVAPEDVGPSIRIYERFGEFEYVSAAIDTWIAGDEKIAQLRALGDELEQAIKNDAPLHTQDALLLAVHDLNAELSELESRFSAQLALAADWANGLILTLLAVFSLIVCLLVILIGRASAKLIARAEKSAAALEEENWLKTARAELGAAMSGAADEQTLAQAVIRRLTPALDAQVGALFLAEEGGGVRLRASHAYAVRKQLTTVVSPGEGLVGQALLEQTPITLTEVPDDYIAVRSGLGEARPDSILVFPVIHEGEVLAVIETAAVGGHHPRALELLDLVAKDVAMALVAARTLRQNQALLAKTQESELRLQEINEELQAQQEELRLSNEELEAQTRNLEQSQAELEAQQQQLEEVNAELEVERSEVAQRNRDLEATRADLEIKARDLEQASKYKSEFLANMSHELRTPLNSINVLSGLLAENRGGGLSDKQVEYARTITESGVQLMTLINEILDLSKIEAGRLDLVLEQVALADVLGPLERQFSPLAQEKGVDLVLDLAADAPRALRTDGQRFSQVIRNLLSNAIKFTESGQVRLAARLATAEDLDRAGLPSVKARALAVAVSDTGIGIPAEQQEHVFQAFRQADGATDRKYGGTGLGLSISRKLMTRLGGTILLDSEAGQGSTFTAIVPVDEEPTEVREEAPAMAPAAPPPTTHQGNESTAPGSNPAPVPDDRDQLEPGDRILLIIEDDPSFATTLVDLARERGYRCLVAGDGESGLVLAQRYKPTAVLLDLTLPGMDGMELMGRMKDDLTLRHIPVHVISGRERMLDTLRAGAIGYLRKPVNLGQLDTAFGRIEELVSRPVRRLLLAEADGAARGELTDLLGGADVEVEVAESGEEALEKIHAHRIDCVVIGDSLTDMSGVELLQRIRRSDERPDTPVVVVSGGEPSHDDLVTLHRYADRVIAEDCAREVLLDETALFLHRVEADLPEDKRRILRTLHDRDAILRGKKILLVDDDMRNVFALSSVLEEEDLEIVVAKNGLESLSRLDEQPDVDLVLMDIMMPEMDGYEAMRRIRQDQRFRRLPIIALTAKAMRDDRARCIEAGASDYLAKPVDTATLLSMMRVWLYS